MSIDMVRCVVLMLLYDQPCHGYLLMELLEARLGRAISPAIIYPFLSILLKEGYLTARQERDGRRVKTVYTMTPEGKRFSKRVFRRLSRIFSTAINPSLSSCANCGCTMYKGGMKEEIDGRSMTFCCVHCAAAYKQGG